MLSGAVPEVGRVRAAINVETFLRPPPAVRERRTWLGVAEWITTPAAESDAADCESRLRPRVSLLMFVARR